MIDKYCWRDLIEGQGTAGERDQALLEGTDRGTGYCWR